MSDAGTDAGAAAAVGATPTFTEREMQMLAWAMQSLKSGPPDIDYEKLASYAGMTNPRSAGNAWAKIRNKLNSATADGAAASPKKTPQGKKTTAKKVDTDGDAGEGEADTPKKTPRKRAPKKQEVDGEEASPKKRGRAAAKKKNSDDEQSGNVKPEPVAKNEKMGDASDVKSEEDAAAGDEV